MNRAVDKLWELIRSLSASEKRYFKIYANKNTTDNKNNYIRLFTIINKQEIYDEDKIREYFEGAIFLKQLHVTKHYLYQLILKSLRSFHAEKSVNSKMFSYFQDIEFLFNKGLISQCKQQINKAKSYMMSHEKHLDLFRLTQWENEMNSELYTHTNDDNLATSLRKDQDLLKQIINLSDYIYVEKELRNSLSVRGAWSDEWINEMESYLQGSLLKDIKLAGSFRAEIAYYETHSLYNAIIGDWDKVEKYSKLGIELLERKSEFINDNMHCYLRLLSKYCYALSINPNKRDQFFERINKLKKLPIKARPFQLRAKQTYFNCLARFRIYLGGEKETRTLVLEIESYLKNTSFLKDEYKLMLLSNGSDLCFVINDFERTLDFLNKILDLKGSNLHHNTECFIRLRLLIIYIELGYFDLLEYTTRSFARFLVKSEHVYKGEALFLRFIQNELTKSISTKDIKKKCTVFLESLKNSGDGKEASKRIILELVWLESKSKGLSVSEILRQRFFSKTLVQES